MEQSRNNTMVTKHHNVRNWHKEHTDKLTFGQKLADKVADGMGSWGFIIAQTLIVVIWMTLNVVGFVYKWDPYPFILLNLLFSTQAAYAAPIIMMSQNRQSQRDREHAEADYQVNLKSKEEIENTLWKKLLFEKLHKKTRRKKE